MMMAMWSTGLDLRCQLIGIITDSVFEQYAVNDEGLEAVECRQPLIIFILVPTAVFPQLMSE